MKTNAPGFAGYGDSCTEEIMKKYSILILVLMAFTLLQAEKLAVLEGLIRPGSIQVNGDRLYIVENPAPPLLIYSMKDYKLIKKFGKPGEGPRELKANAFGPPMVVNASSEYLLVNSTAKLTYFIRDGVYIKEKKVPSMQLYLEFGDGYINSTGVVIGKDIFLAVVLADKDFKKGKQLYLSDITVGLNATFNYPNTPFAYSFPRYKDRLYVSSGKMDFVIDVFDTRGTKLYTIKKDYKNVKVTAEYEAKVKKDMKSDPNFGKFWEYMKKKLSFKSHFPALKTLWADNGRLYAVTHKKKNGKSECIVMDLKGKEIKRVYLPIEDQSILSSIMYYTFNNNYFYQLVEDEEEEQWELHRIKIE